MKINKILSICIAGLILCFSVLVPLQFHKAVNSSISLLKVAIPYPGKTVFFVDKIIKFNPFNKSARETEPENQKNNKYLGFLFYFLSTILVYNEKYLLIMLLILAALCIRYCRTLKLNSVEVYVPPDMKYYNRWRLKFITPAEKCIQYLANKYDINPILYIGTGMSLEKKPALFKMKKARVFLFIAAGYYRLNNYEIIK